jgi:hypothetical protein
MTDTSGYAQAYQQASDAFGKFVPGFEFLQGLVRNAGKSMPSMGQWIAPTLDPEELERRIEELKTVQFWLEQNARMIGATVQALEVQRMTLGALKGMNVSMGDLTEALKVKVPDLFTAGAEAAAAGVKAASAASAAAASAASAAAAPAPAAEPARPSAPIDDAHSDDAPAAGGASPAVAPMQWWGALTQQFTTLASQAMQATSDAARQATEAARQASEATSDATAQAVQAAQAAAAAAAEPVVKAATAATAAAASAASAASPAKASAAKPATKPATKPASKASAKAPGKTASKTAGKTSTQPAAPRKAAPRSSS